MPLLLLALLPAFAAESPDDLLAKARAAERSGDVVLEREVCRSLLAEAAESAPALRCRQRLDWLRAREDADGSLRTLSAFMAARRAPADAQGEVEALVQTPGLPPALEAELHAWLASSALSRGDPQRALQSAERALAADPELASARRQRSQALAALGRWEEAEASEAAGPTRSARPREGVQLLRAQAWSRRLNAASWLALLGFVLPSLPLARRGWAQRGGLEPAGLLPLSAATLGSAALAGAWTPSVGLAIAATLPALGTLHMLSAGAGVALRHPLQRALLGGGAALASLGACYLILGGLGALEGVLP